MKLAVNVTFDSDVTAEEIVDTAAALAAYLEAAGEAIADKLLDHGFVFEVMHDVSPVETGDRAGLIAAVEAELSEEQHWDSRPQSFDLELVGEEIDALREWLAQPEDDDDSRAVKSAFVKLSDALPAPSMEDAIDCLLRSSSGQTE